MHNKAVTEEECDLELRYAKYDRRPDYMSGLRVIFVKPEDYERHHITISTKFEDLVRFTDTVYDKINIDFWAYHNLYLGFGNNTHSSSSDMVELDFIMDRLICSLKYEDCFNAAATTFPAIDYFGDRHNCAVILTPKINMNSDNYLRYALAISSACDLPEMPGFASQWQYQALLHEIGHGICGGESFFKEPRSEMVSAIMCRKAFADNRFLSCTADMRAVDTMFKFDRVSDCGNAASDLYGYKMVEAVDYVQSLPEEFIDGLRGVDIKRISSQSFVTLSENVRKIGEMLKSRNPEALEHMDFNALESEAGDILLKPSRLIPEEVRILSRFKLACERLAVGSDAYDEQINPLQRDKLITFSPVLEAG